MAKSKGMPRERERDGGEARTGKRRKGKDERTHRGAEEIYITAGLGCYTAPRRRREGGGWLLNPRALPHSDVKP